jgi:hypothetical protein
VIEDLVAAFPEEFFDEPLRLKSRQPVIQGRRLDLLFEDGENRLLLLELKRGELDRQAVGQAGEYFGLLKTEYPDRDVRMGVLGTAILPELRRFLEAFGVEVFVVAPARLLEVARTHGVDPEVGIDTGSGRTPKEPAFVGKRSTPSDEASFFALIDGLVDDQVKNRLAAVYGAAKTNSNITIGFTSAGAATFSVGVPGGRSGKLLKIGVTKKGDKGKITFLWKQMIRAFPRDAVETFASLIDRLAGRSMANTLLDPVAKEGTFDTFDLHRPDTFPGERFDALLEGLQALVSQLAQ